MAFAFFSFLRSLFRPRVAGGQPGCPPYAQADARSTRRVGTGVPTSRGHVRVIHKSPGRLVISGRLADVCAELDRLAALEAAQPALAPAR